MEPKEGGPRGPGLHHAPHGLRQWQQALVANPVHLLSGDVPQLGSPALLKPVGGIDPPRPTPLALRQGALAFTGLSLT
jgi:hypothetical protein